MGSKIETPQQQPVPPAVASKDLLHRDYFEITQQELRAAANTLRKVYVVLAEDRSQWPWWKRFGCEYQDSDALIRIAVKLDEFAKKYEDEAV